MLTALNNIPAILFLKQHAFIILLFFITSAVSFNWNKWWPAFFNLYLECIFPLMPNNGFFPVGYNLWRLKTRFWFLFDLCHLSFLQSSPLWLGLDTNSQQHWRRRLWSPFPVVRTGQKKKSFTHAPPASAMPQQDILGATSLLPLGTSPIVSCCNDDKTAVFRKLLLLLWPSSKSRPRPLWCLGWWRK